MKKIRIWSFALLAILLLMTGCSNTAPMAKSAAEAEVSADGIYASQTTSAKSTDFSAQKLIKTVELQAQTGDLDALLSRLEKHIANLGGYVEASEVRNMNRSDSGIRRADMTIRVPADRLDEFVQQVEGESNVISSSTKQEDVTLKYADTESRMKALRTEHDRLLELMTKAESMEDVLTIQARITEVLYELESITSQLRVLDDQISYATVKLQVEETKKLTVTEELSFWGQTAQAFRENVEGIGDTFSTAFMMILAYSPQVLFGAALIVVIVILWKKQAKKAMEKMQNQEISKTQPPENPES